jgi:dipeptidyl-peptidase-4
MSGMASEHISLGVYNISTNSSLFIEKDDAISEKYLTNITWSPDESSIYIQVLNRLQNHMKLNKYSVKDGSLAKTLFEEQNDKYMEPLNPLLFLNKTPVQFIYQSRRDGFNHAYLYTTEGTLVNQLTSGNFEITDILLLDSNDNLFYTSTEESPIEQHAYKLNTRTGQKAKLTRDAGTHKVMVNQNSKYCIDTYSSTLVPRVINIISATGKIEQNLLTAQNPLKNFNMPEMQLATLKAADGKTDLYYRLIKPIDFDSNNKYPAIIYVYGGPHTQLVTNSWLGGARLWDHMMAQKGYVVLTVDSRGSSNRGLEFENIIHRQCGIVEMQDQLEGVKLLKQLGYVDMDRVGVHGWSYGGFITLTMMVNNPGMFKTGVAGGPVTDWKYYEVMYGERYMDMPSENPVGYEKTSLLSQAKNLKGKLLIIHGAVDPTVVWQNSLDFIQECIKNQVPVDYFVYPLSEHNVRGYDRIHLMGKITDYFEDHLK